MYSDESTPEYRSEELEGRASFYDTPWKRIMAGSTLMNSVGEYSLQSRVAKSITWKTFAIH